jgi:LAS superfamily LD-carboxypeptidase LdcB
MIKIEPKTQTNILLISLAVFFGIGGFMYWRLFSQNVELKDKNKNLETTLQDTKNDLLKTRADKQALSDGLVQKSNEFESLRGQVETATKTVDDLVKLSQTDKELLQKYSKVYFLNENFVPPHLTQIDPKYIFDKTQNEFFLTNTYPFLANMIDAAARDGIQLQVDSAYRSFDEQKDLKSSYKITYGSGANKFSADQGYSEHQLGTTADLTNSKDNGDLSISFDKTDSYKWLKDNAYKYGFILSYPKGNQYYQYEPWHWRFVGVKLATFMREEGKNFYDLDQREIDKYLISFFDN